jgi:uncharacterized damage-inducible protein DinB
VKDIPDLLKGLERTGRILSEFVQSIPAEKMNLRRGEGFWTIAEHVSHLAQLQPMLLHDYWHMYRMKELWLTRDAYLMKLD